MAKDLSKLAKTASISEFEKEWCAQQTPPIIYNSMTGTDHQNAGYAYNFYKSFKEENKLGGTGGKIFETIAAITKTQEVDVGNQIADSTYKASEFIEGFVNKSTGSMIAPLELLDKLKDKVAGGIGDYLQEQTQLLHQVNEGTSLTGKLSEGVREELTASNTELKKYGIELNEVVNLSLKNTASTSKFNLINSETWDMMAQSAKAYVGELSDLTSMLPDFEKIGYGARDTAKQIQISGQRMMKLGLDSKSMLKEVGQNLNKINEYAFKDGVQGLSNMITKAKEFRMSMEETFKIADNVIDPEKAIDMAANLMSIGGAIGDLGDPMKMMYMATNNVEGIQDALIGATSSLATFNKESGKFEVIGINIRKAKAMADAMGVSMSELRKGAIAAAERTSAAMDMLSNGLKLDKDQTDLITNLAHMKDGKMVMEIQGDKMKEILGIKGDVKEIALENLTQSQAEQLAEYQKRESEKTPEDIIRGQATNIENSTRDINYILRLLIVQSSKTAGYALDTLASMLGVNPKEFTGATKKFRDEKSKDIKSGFEQANEYVKENLKGDINNVVGKGKTGLNKIMGVDNSQKEKEVKGDNTGSNSVVTVKHEIKESSVVFNYVKNLWEEQFSRKDPRQYTSDVINLVTNNKTKFKSEQ